MGVSFSCVCPVIDNEFRHNIVKSSLRIHSFFGNVMTKNCRPFVKQIDVLEKVHVTFQMIFLNSQQKLVSHTFVFVYMLEFGYYILFGACRNEGK